MINYLAEPPVIQPLDCDGDRVRAADPAARRALHRGGANDDDDEGAAHPQNPGQPGSPRRPLEYRRGGEAATAPTPRRLNADQSPQAGGARHPPEQRSGEPPPPLRPSRAAQR